MDWLVDLPQQICIESHSNGNLHPLFNLKAYLHYIEPFQKKSDGSLVSSLFWGNNRQHMPACAKIISSWVKKVLSIAKAHVSGYSLAYCTLCHLGSWPLPGFHPAGG